MKLEYVKGVVFRREPSGGILFNIDTGDLQVTEGVETNLEHDLEDFINELKEKGILV